MQRTMIIVSIILLFPWHGDDAVAYNVLPGIIINTTWFLCDAQCDIHNDHQSSKISRTNINWIHIVLWLFLIFTCSVMEDSPPKVTHNHQRTLQHLRVT